MKKRYECTKKTVYRTIKFRKKYKNPLKTTGLFSKNTNKKIKKLLSIKQEK